MPLGTDNMQSARSQHLLMALLPRVTNMTLLCIIVGTSALQVSLEITAKYDISASAGHIGGYSYRRRSPCVRNDICLTLMLLGVQHVMPYTSAGQFLRQQL